MANKVRVYLLIIVFMFTALLTYSQQDNRYDSGLNLPFNEKAGDVNPQSGNISLSFTDLSLPGRGGLNFSFGRIWSLNQANVFTMYRDPVNGANRLSSETLEKQNHLGIGWSTSLPYLLEDTSSGSQVLNLFFKGNVYEIDTDGIKVNNPSESNILWYDLLDMRVYKSSYVAYSDFTPYNLEQLKLAYPIADTIYTRSEYQLILKDNSKYWFRKEGNLMMQEDKTGLNKIWYFYNNKNTLCLVVDTIGRKIEFKYNNDGNLNDIAWTVTKGNKLANGSRALTDETRHITYNYIDGETYNYLARLSTEVIDYKKPFALQAVTDSMGNKTTYQWQEKLTAFTYDSKTSHAENVYLALTGITSMDNGSGSYKSKRLFEYEAPPRGLDTKYFYGGYMEYYKISRQYLMDRHGRIMNDTSYIYLENGESGNSNQYSSIIKQGNVTTTYIYSLDDAPNKKDVLEKLDTETLDGFKQRVSYSYNSDRCKIFQEVSRQGKSLYSEQFRYDAKGNLKWQKDKLNLINSTEYDPVYSIPIRQVIEFIDPVDNNKRTYESENSINNLGQVIKQTIYLTDQFGKKGVAVKKIEYDPYGNPIAETNAAGYTIHTVYDAVFHSFPVKVWQDVTIGAWADTTDSHWWIKEADRKQQVRIRSWKVFNTDGTLWIELDNEGYAIEHYYDKNGIEIETVNPDLNDERSFAKPINVAADTPQGSDFDDFLLSPFFNNFLTTRLDNPGVKVVIDYVNEFIKSYTDIQKSRNEVKISGVQKDGLGNVEQEIEYGAGESIYAYQNYEYDNLGRLISQTDPDAIRLNGTDYTVNDVTIKRFDKTWIIRNDDLGRRIIIHYPDTQAGKSAIKRISYNDVENSITTIDPEGKRIFERKDWNGNTIEMIDYGDAKTPAAQYQIYKYIFDPLNRKRAFCDPQGIVTQYLYDERGLLVAENYGTDAGSDFMDYNDLGQLIKKTDRKKQTITFSYDELGRNCETIHYASEADYQAAKAEYMTLIEYNNRGNAIRISNQNLVEYYTYDFADRVISLDRYLKDSSIRNSLAIIWPGDASAQIFSFNYKYNDAGMLTDMHYPDGSVHQFTYDPYLSRLKTIGEGPGPDTVTPFVGSIEYYPSGVVNRMNYANNTFQQWDFDNRKRIKRIKIADAKNTSEELNYNIDGSGNILAINANEYEYDGLNRIIGAATLLPGQKNLAKLVNQYFGTYTGKAAVNNVNYNLEADVWPVNAPDGRINGADHLYAALQDTTTCYDTESFAYDLNSNRLSLVQNGNEYSYEYGVRNQLTKIYLKKKVSLIKELFIEYFYDANGNTSKRIIHTKDGLDTVLFDYDTMNRLLRTSEYKDGSAAPAITDYYYDNAGNRILKKNTRDITLYLRHGQIAVAMDIELPGSDAKFKAGEAYKGKINRYVLSGDLLAGRITKTISLDDKVRRSKSWYHLDHLNSTKCVTDEHAVVEVSYTYRAFGEQLKRLDAAGNDPGDTATYSYNGKELDEITNLYYFNARYYDATTGRFINLDPVQDGENWYIYAYANPLSFADPTGLENVKPENAASNKTENNQINNTQTGNNGNNTIVNYQEDNSNLKGGKGDIGSGAAQTVLGILNMIGGALLSALMPSSGDLGNSLMNIGSRMLNNGFDKLAQGINQEETNKLIQNRQPGVIVNNTYNDNRTSNTYNTTTQNNITNNNTTLPDPKITNTVNANKDSGKKVAKKDELLKTKSNPDSSSQSNTTNPNCDCCNKNKTFYEAAMDKYNKNNKKPK